MLFWTFQVWSLFYYHRCGCVCVLDFGLRKDVTIAAHLNRKICQIAFECNWAYPMHEDRFKWNFTRLVPVDFYRLWGNGHQGSLTLCWTSNCKRLGQIKRCIFWMSNCFSILPRSDSSSQMSYSWMVRISIPIEWANYDSYHQIAALYLFPDAGICLIH